MKMVLRLLVSGERHNSYKSERLELPERRTVDNS
jgi:hypothetical protein